MSPGLPLLGNLDRDLSLLPWWTLFPFTLTKIPPFHGSGHLNKCKLYFPFCVIDPWGNWSCMSNTLILTV